MSVGAEGAGLLNRPSPLLPVSSPGNGARCILGFGGGGFLYSTPPTPPNRGFVVFAAAVACLLLSKKLVVYPSCFGGC